MCKVIDLEEVRRRRAKVEPEETYVTLVEEAAQAYDDYLVYYGAAVDQMKAYLKRYGVSMVTTEEKLEAIARALVNEDIKQERVQ